MPIYNLSKFGYRATRLSSIHQRVSPELQPDYGLFKTTFPDVSVIEDNSDGDFASVVLELRGEPGAIQR